MQDIEFIDLNYKNKISSSKELLYWYRILNKLNVELYDKSFKIESEKEHFSAWLRSLIYDPDAGNQVFITVCGKNLKDVKNAEIIGFIQSEYYISTQVALVCYVVRSKDYSIHTDRYFDAVHLYHHHEMLFQEAARHFDAQELRMILQECNNPLKIEDYTKEDVIDPEKRLQIMTSKYGFQEVGFDYIQSPLYECKNQNEIDNAICDKLVLMMFRPEKYKPDIIALEKFIHTFIGLFSKVKDYKELNNFRIDVMMNQIDMIKNTGIPLIKTEQSKEHRSIISKTVSDANGLRLLSEF